MALGASSVKASAPVEVNRVRRDRVWGTVSGCHRSHLSLEFGAHERKGQPLAPAFRPQDCSLRSVRCQGSNRIVDKVQRDLSGCGEPRGPVCPFQSFLNRVRTAPLGGFVGPSVRERGQ